MNELEEKYIDLLLNKCIYPKSKSLFISYDKCNIDFIEKLIKKAKESGFVDILIEEKDIILEQKIYQQRKLKLIHIFIMKIRMMLLEKMCFFTSFNDIS